MSGDIEEREVIVVVKNLMFFYLVRIVVFCCKYRN